MFALNLVDEADLFKKEKKSIYTPPTQVKNTIKYTRKNRLGLTNNIGQRKPAVKRIKTEMQQTLSGKPTSFTEQMETVPFTEKNIERSNAISFHF